MSAQKTLFDGIAPLRAGKRTAKSEAEKKASKAADARKRYAENPAKARAVDREWYAKNLDKARAQNRKSYARNRDKILAESRKRRSENPAKVKARYREWYAKMLHDATLLLGEECACCGSRDRLTIDHKKPIRHRRRQGKSPRGGMLYCEVVRNPEAFQRLCFACNRLKNDGPCCPCRWWDSIDSTWREAKHGMRETRLKDLAGIYYITNSDLDHTDETLAQAIERGFEKVA